MNSKEAIGKIMKILNISTEKFYDGKTEQGISVKMEGDTLEIGKTLYVATDEGMIPAPAGTHKMEDGAEVEVDEDGKVAKIKMGDMENEPTDDAKKEAEQQKTTENKPTEMAESQEPEKPEMEDGDIELADGSVFRIGGESPETGTRIKKVGYDGTLSAIADGAYETKDGMVMQIVGGEIKGIQSKAAEAARGGMFTEAKTDKGVMLESPTFDVGEKIDVVDGDKKEPAPDGEHQVILTDAKGNKVKIRVMVHKGEIVEREDVEEAQPESEKEIGDESMDAFMEVFSTAMKQLNAKIDDLATKQSAMELKFKKFSNEPAGTRIIKNQINPNIFEDQKPSKFEGFKKLRETLSHN
jgi:hypothetical protein